MDDEEKSINSEASHLLTSVHPKTDLKRSAWLRLGLIIGGCSIVALVVLISSKPPTPTKPFQILANREFLIGDATKDGFARIDENLIFYDEFLDAKSLSSGIWNPARTMDGGGNKQFQYYTDSKQNLYVNTTDGSLRLKPGLFPDLSPINGIPAGDVMMGNCVPYPECSTFEVPDCSTETGCRDIGKSGDYIVPTTSARVDTQNTFTFTYGRMEMRVRLPRGDWLWPGIWMMPQESLFGGWPEDGEIDLIESHGNAPGYLAQGHPAGRDVILSTLHAVANTWWKSQGKVSGIDWTEDYHVFGLYWSDTEYYSYYYDENGNQIKMVDLSAEKGGYQKGFMVPPLGLDPNKKSDLNQSDLTTYYPDIYDGLPLSAPFHQPFYLILNVAVGGYQFGCGHPSYWGPDAIWCQCWPQCSNYTVEFWNLRDKWYPTWLKADANDKLSLAVDWIKIWQ